MVSIIVPCYNQAEYLNQCLLSVLNQSYKNWECIIVNDGSTDNTRDIALEWVKQDSRFIYISKKNGGVASARNQGIISAKGDWILPLDGDDYIEEDYLLEASKKFNDGYNLIYCNASLFGEKNEFWNLPEFSLTNLAQDNVIFCSAFFKKSDWLKIGGYDEKMIYGIEDWDFWISLLKQNNSVYKIEKELFNYRIKKVSRQVDFNESLEKRKNALMYLEKKHYDFFAQQLGTLHENFHKSKKLEKENSYLKKIKFSKKIEILKKIFKF